MVKFPFVSCSKVALARTSVLPASGPALRFLSTSNFPSFPSFPFKRPSGTEVPREFAELRSRCPVAKVGIVANTSWAWLLTKHTDICRVLDDNENFSKIRTREGFPELTKGGKLAAMSHKPTFVDMDPPEHTVQRAMVSPMFSPEHVETLAPIIQEIANHRLKDLLVSPSSKADLVSVFALPMVSEVMYRILGIPIKDMGYLSTCNAVRTNGSATAAQAATANQALVNYLTKLVETQADAVVSGAGKENADMISVLVREQLLQGHIELVDLVQVVFLLLVAGNATTVSMVALGVQTLLQYPDQLNELKKNPVLMPNAVEELCRLHTASALATRRVTLKDVVISGTTIKAGEGVIAATQSGNRDEEVFDRPEEFNLHRVFTPSAKSLAFGHGQHQCVAEWLAKKEVEIALTTLFHALPALRLAPANVEGEPEGNIQYFPADADVGITEMHVTWA